MPSPHFLLSLAAPLALSANRMFLVIFRGDLWATAQAEDEEFWMRVNSRREARMVISSMDDV